MLRAIRRIVTGHDPKGRSIIVSDGPSPHVLTLPGRPDFALTNLWVTDATPASNEAEPPRPPAAGKSRLKLVK